MSRLTILVLVAIGLALVAGALPAWAQDIMGISLQPGAAAPAGLKRGTADIVQSKDGGFLISVDLANSIEELSLDSFEGATAFVVWAVDMDGSRHNLGVLGSDLLLEEAPVEFVVAKVYITAEADPGAMNPTGEPIARAILRNVQETETAAAEPAEDEEEAAEEKAAETKEQVEPKALPTTGAGLPDLMVLAAVAMLLVLAGVRLRTVRL